MVLLRLYRSIDFPPTEIRECFKLYDKSGKGYISPLEFKSVMLSVGEELDDEEIRETIIEIDEDGKSL